MVTIDRLRGLGMTQAEADAYSAYIGADPGTTTDVTGNSSIWANVLSTVGQLGAAFAPAIRNITTPYATYSSVSPYGMTSSSVPVGTPVSVGSMGIGSPIGGIGGGTLLLLGVGLVAVMAMSRGH